MLINKKGKFTITQILSLVLGVASTVIIIILMISILSPNFDKGEKTAEGYFDTFMEQVEVANDGEVGEFSLWQKQETGTDKRIYYLVYFGDKYRYEVDGEDFVSLGVNENHICVCYLYEKETYCNYCEDLKFPINSWVDYDRWAIAEQKKISIELKGGEYVVAKEGW